MNVHAVALASAVVAASLCGCVAPSSCERAVAEGFNPVFSPDGGSIAFQRLEDGIFKLGIVGAAGGDVKWIEKGPGNAAYPEWTPSGDLVYTAGHDYETAYEGLSRKSTNGYNLYLWSNGKKRKLTSGRCRDYTPSVTPDGKKVYFITTRYSMTQKVGETLPVTIAELDLENGGEPRPVVVMSTKPTPDAYNSGFVQPAVSPDGKMLLWSHLETFNSDFWRIYGADVGKFDRKGWRRITPDDVVGLAPRWHPGGKLICYTGFRNGDPCWGVWVQNLETGKTRRLTSGENPAFSPDGKSIAYDRDGVVYVRPFGLDDEPCCGNCGEGKEGQRK